MYQVFVEGCQDAVLEIEIEADSVNTGSHMKDNKLKGKDFFNVEESPLITFQSTKIVQTGPNTFDVEGNFTIRGVIKTGKRGKCSTEVAPCQRSATSFPTIA
jgi:polyisoprenoid-binding protein YceI